MEILEFSFKDSEGIEIFVYKWHCKDSVEIKGIVQIAHGMAEMSIRYERFARALTSAGYIVYANDHRGHGKTAKTVENLGYCGEDGFNWMIKDMKQLNDIIKNDNPGVPIFLFEHSMGSLLSQRYISLYGDTIKGVLLSGTSGKQGIMIEIGILMAKREIKKIGERGQSKLLNKMTFGGYNNSFKPYKTEFDWLSRDNVEVDKYVNDPFCGTVFTAGFYYDFFMGIKETHKLENMRNIPVNLPVYFISGELDPVGKSCKTVLGLIKDYKSLGILDVTHKFYKGARHEILNEINKDEVINDIINWLDIH